jgi:hypothetical protein
MLQRFDRRHQLEPAREGQGLPAAVPDATRDVVAVRVEL